MLLKKIITVIVCFWALSVSATSLIENFDTPKHQYKPWAFWYWINGNMTQEGIHTDLKSMAEAGLGGVVLMHINEHNMIPQGPVRFLSDEYKTLLKYSFDTAEKFNLEINLYNSEGWSVAGGPWITPELSMKELVWSEMNFNTPPSKIMFPKPHAPLGFYKDIAVLAFPTPKGFIEPNFNDQVERVVVSSDKPESKNSAFVVDSDWNTQVFPKKDAQTGETFVQLDFKKPYTFSNAFVKFSAYGMKGRNYLYVSDDGENYKEIGFAKRGQIYDDIGCFQFKPVTARHAKFVFKPTDNKLLLTAMPKVNVAVREIALDNRHRVQSWCKKAAHSFPFFDPDAERKRFAKNSPKATSIAFGSIVNVTEYLNEDGTLNWTPPNDNWTVIRFGMSSTEAINRPASLGGEGLEVDKMNVRALDAHFNGLLKTARDLAGDQVGKAFASTHADSWEVGRQNWTQNFETTFEQKRGYSPIKYLPSTLGYVIGNDDTTERFLWDMRKTIADLIAERFYGGMRERANAMGIKFSAQSVKPFIDNLYALGQADIVYANSNFIGVPTVKNERNLNSSYMTAKMAASAGSIYGREVRSESFTALPEANRWLNHPEYYKPLADAEMSAGVRKITHHLFTHQPWTTLQPGMTLGYWGLHFERTQTWWHEVPTWTQYITRTQAMMSQGQPVIDILHFLGDDTSTKTDRKRSEKLAPKGYDFEFISADGLLNKVYVNAAGKLAYATGRQYSVLALPNDVSMRPKIVQKIQQLLEQGAIIVGQPPEVSPSLEGGIRADKKVQELVKTIWGGAFKKQIFNSMTDALNTLKIKPDLNIVGAESELFWRHHHDDRNNQDFYFISNSQAKPTQFNASFRVTGKVPELWNPYTGTRERITDYKEKNGVTTIALKLEQIQSYFIVFSEKPTTTKMLNTAPHKTASTLKGDWQVDFIKGKGAPNPIKLDKLIDLKDHPQENVSYFSGTARYQLEFTFKPKKKQNYLLDLGEVHQFARVRLNGIDLGVQMWAPYQYPLSRHLKDGKNILEVEITNLWPNRLIGDERQYPDPDAASWKSNNYQGEQLKDFPAWLKGAAPKQPGKRNTFATWKHWSANDELVPSGLIGPVTIVKQKAK